MATDTLVHVEDISLWRGQKMILEGVNWTTRPGEQWALVGANGSGKTTLLQVVSGNLWPSKGTVSVLGHRFGTVDLRELRKRIGWVSSALLERIPLREPALKVVISGSTAAIGLWEEPSEGDAALAHELLRQMGCEDVESQEWRTLSHGEKQRVLIARALMADPRLLILDEPCAGLDLAAREGLLETLEQLAVSDDGPGLIMVTHHIEELMPSITHVLVLDRGRVAAAGPKETVLTGEVLSQAMGIGVTVERRNGRYWAKAR